MTEFQAYEFTDIDDFAAWTAEPVLRRVRDHYDGHVWWRRVYASRSSPDLSALARAAEHQGLKRAEAVVQRLREAIFVERHDPEHALDDVPGLDVWRLRRDLDSHAVRWSIEADRKLSRRHPTIPTVLFRGPGGDIAISGAQSYETYSLAIDTVRGALAEAA